MISVIVVTRNRTMHLQTCIHSIYKNKYPDFEVIIVDQSDEKDQKSNSLLRKNKNLHYIKDNDIGKTKGSNEGIRKAKGDILSFIDDDVIVSSNWLETIATHFQNNPSCAAMFGKILPFEPHAHKGKISPACFTKKKSDIISSVNHVFYSDIGLGSNMSVKKTVFNSIGLFKEWLGPGIYGFSGGEDGEFITRMLSNNIKTYYIPNCLAWHNRWLTKEEYNSLLIKYSGGEIAYETYYFLCGYRFYGVLLFHTITSRILPADAMHICKNLLKKSKYKQTVIEIMRIFKNALIFTFYAIKGIVIGSYYWLKK